MDNVVHSQFSSHTSKMGEGLTTGSDILSSEELESVVYNGRVDDLSFVTGSPVDASVRPTLSSDKLVDRKQDFSVLLTKLTMDKKQSREDEVREIMTRLIRLLKMSAGDVHTGPDFISPLNAEYAYVAGGHLLCEVAREAKLLLEGQFGTIGSIVQLGFAVCLDPEQFMSHNGEHIYGHHEVVRLVIHRLLRLLEGLKSQCASLATSSTARSYAAVFLSLVSAYEHYYGDTITMHTDLTSSKVLDKVLALSHSMSHRFSVEDQAKVAARHDKGFFLNHVTKRYRGDVIEQENAVLAGIPRYSRSALSLQRKAVRALMVRRHYWQDSLLIVGFYLYLF